ncbi:hypothetical protein NYP18_09295 [Corynebacterium sp. YIM 101645]|uniref:Uncharacterized protein n=1 Tax=Corynebacterium lemuris TaxID=1859292 RepID=A0ABT2G0Z1_9CORY|nr:hypothetical protein [Corynebacterium lemuris]MCS5479854.1 hypothetical protein [Corynebacterium lemuris]
MIFLDDSRGNWIVAKDRRELLDALLARLPHQPDNEALTYIAAGCLGCIPTDIIITEE